jgi:RNA polymerase sigma-70 factor, ECF subfamily
MDGSGAASRSREERVAVSDLELIRRIVERDETALAGVYDRYASLVYAVALRVLRDAAAAEEVLQDIFYRLWIVAPRFDPARGSLPAWLAVSSRHRAIDRLRRREPDKDADASAAEIHLPIDLEEQVHRDGLVDRVRAALVRLPEAQRKLMELAYFEGLTHSELASRTGEPLGTIKSRLRAAVASLRKEFGEFTGSTGQQIT